MTPLRTLLLITLLAAAVILSVGIGAADIPMADVVAALRGGGDDTARAVVLGLRLPRAALAGLVGAGLALSGAVFQALLRNPLAEPYVLGVSGGAAVGAVAAVVLGWGIEFPWALPLSALVGAILAIAAVLRIATGVARGLDIRVLLLTGVVVGAFFNAIIYLMLTFASAETFRSAIFWIMGSLSGASWSAATLLAAPLVPTVIVLLLLARPLNLLAVGEETALYLGTRVERLKRAAYVIASLLVAATVAVSGVIGFVGLIVPHAVRLAWGSDHRTVLPASMLAGATFLILTDTAARTVAAPAELPLGVITALVGVPLFVVLLARRSL